jgi:hypothetical protein
MFDPGKVPRLRCAVWGWKNRMSRKFITEIHYMGVTLAPACAADDPFMPQRPTGTFGLAAGLDLEEDGGLGRAVRTPGRSGISGPAAINLLWPGFRAIAPWSFVSAGR